MLTPRGPLTVPGRPKLPLSGLADKRGSHLDKTGSNSKGASSRNSVRSSGGTSHHGSVQSGGHSDRSDRVRSGDQSGSKHRSSGKSGPVPRKYSTAIMEDFSFIL